MKPNPLKLVASRPLVKTYGSPEFIRRDRNPALVSPTRFEPSKQVREDDVWL